jgi:hypothetical protein
MLSLRRISLMAVVALVVAAAPAAADAKRYKGKTKGGSSITFTLSGKKISKVNTVVPAICLSIQSTASRAGAELYQPPGSFTLGKTVKRKASKRPSALARYPLTMNYTFSSKKRGGKVTGKAKVSYSFIIPSLFGNPTIYTCLGTTSFTAS